MEFLLYLVLGGFAGVLAGLFGVGGGIMAVAPGRMSIAAFAPPLDDAGTSVKAQAAIAHLAAALNLGLYQ